MSRRQLAAAYRATAYVVALPEGECALRIGARSAPLDRWLAGNGYARWCWLTAVNPASRRLSPDDNARRLEALADDLAALGYRALAGTAIADAGDWVSEASFFVPGLDPVTARDLARRHGQNAFLAGEAGHPVYLIWIN